MTISLKDYTFTRLVFILITAIKKILIIGLQLLLKYTVIKIFIILWCHKNNHKINIIKCKI